MTNSVAPDETARYEPSHQGLHCLQRHLLWSEGVTGLKHTHVHSRTYTFWIAVCVCVGGGGCVCVNVCACVHEIV